MQKFIFFRVEKISFVDQFIMAYGGLRGGIAFGLMKLTSLQLVPHANAMLCVTLVVVFFWFFKFLRTLF